MEKTSKLKMVLLSMNLLLNTNNTDLLISREAVVLWFGNYISSLTQRDEAYILLVVFLMSIYILKNSVACIKSGELYCDFPIS